jgi:hypothetical protein
VAPIAGSTALMMTTAATAGRAAESLALRGSRSLGCSRQVLHRPHALNPERSMLSEEKPSLRAISIGILKGLLNMERRA